MNRSHDYSFSNSVSKALSSFALPKNLFAILALTLFSMQLSAQDSPYCETSVFHFADMNPASEAILTIENTGPNSMQIVLSSPNPADPIDDVVIPNGSGAMITEAVTGPNEYTATLTWVGVPPANVTLNVLWSFDSFGGFWQLNANDFDIPFASVCPPPAGNTSPYCETSVFHFADMNPASEAILTIENTGPNSMQIVLSSPNPADPIDDVVIPNGSGATIIESVTGPNEYTVDLTWGGPPPPVVTLNVLWSFDSFGGFWQLNAGDFDIDFDVSCSAMPDCPEVPAPIAVNEPSICQGEVMTGSSPYCGTSVFHFADLNPASEAILTIENTGPNSMQIVLSSPNPVDPIDDVVIPNGSGATIIESVTGPNEYTVDLTWGGVPPPVVTLNVLWSFQNFGGFWQLSPGDFDIPFDASCGGGMIEPLEVDCPLSVMTLDPDAGYISFMNVFDDPTAMDMSCGGGYCFGVFNWGFNGFDHPDLVATFNGDELTLQGTPLPDPSPYWYDTPGGPGVIGNNIMEANHFVEDVSGQFNGTDLTYSVEVASIDFSCGHETSLYIREFAPGFAIIINETFVPLTGTGVFSVTMPISATPGNIVQYGHQTLGNNLWPTDVDGCGSAVLLPVEHAVSWYNAPTGGDLQGEGPSLDPTGTTAEEGPFDPNVAGTYTYYAECIDPDGCVSERTPVVFTVNANPAAPVVVNEPAICEGDEVDPNDLLEVECPMAITLDPAAGYISFMNVFDDPSAMDMSCGGGYCFGVFNWGFNGFDHPDLVATFNGDELTLQGTPLPDPSPYWYDTPGGPGVIGNNIMEANHFVEDQSGQYNGSNLSYSVEVASIDFSCGHETSLYIREFAPGFAFIINETFVPLTGTGVFTVTMPISATPGNIVQYGHQTVGNNLWPTDVDGCGSAVLLPVENTVTWYDAPVDGNIQGTGLTLNPTGTTAEEGPFDPNVAGTYTYYAECTDGNGCVSERTPVVFTVNANPAAPVVVNQPQICEGDVVDPTNLLEV